MTEDAYQSIQDFIIQNKDTDAFVLIVSIACIVGIIATLYIGVLLYTSFKKTNNDT
ncbi:MAG: hypothetical protein QM526_01040 [Alphaproteobacteria bacterium]|nr:hypothetical protein [Alphaproteobacteria bacterium]